MDTIRLADEAGANVNLTWWGQGPYANNKRLRALDWPNRTFRKFRIRRRANGRRSSSTPTRPAR